MQPTQLSPRIKSWVKDLEPEAFEQIKNVAALPFIHRHVAVMPDAHLGIGSTVGTVIATQGAIIPAAVGVDIGCGMAALRLPFGIDRLEKLKELRHSIERSIPTGFNSNKNLSDRAGKTFTALGAPPSLDPSDNLVRGAAHQLGTLGGGNHFIEICQDQEGTAWLMLHSGSRNIGKVLAERHIRKAKGLLREVLETLPHPDLAHFTEGSDEFKLYLKDLLWAQAYAKANREEMLLRVLKDISYHLFQDARLLEELPKLFVVNCHHNYCQRETHFREEVWVTRKGAVSARAGEYGIIPGSMGTRSYIVKGKGQPDSFHSCSHGAGRRMSRGDARRKFNERDLIKQTEGVECRKDGSLLDEIPSAYKDIDEVMAQQIELVEPVYELKQILCVKGS